MAPKPQKVSMHREESGEGTGIDVPVGERVVISGMSGLYPNAHNVKELADTLYNKINPVTSSESRWEFNHFEMTGYTGKVSGLNYFDAQFFKVHYLMGNHMEVMSRKTLEQVYAAIYDAGMNLDQLNGKKVGVYIGMNMSETETTGIFTMRLTGKHGFILLGCNRTMYANRISYWLNAKGPSMVIDQSCCSSMMALELAYQAIMRGDCESAIVGGTNLCLHPHSLINYGRLYKMSPDGKTKSFDENADGSTISEAINILFLQKAKDALRIYAEVVNIKSEFSSENEPGLYRNPNDMTKFLKQFYEETDVPPQAVDYVEGCGSAIPEADKSLLEAYENVFCGDRNNSLLVGSVMSNLGNVQAGSGIAAITKILLGYHTGVLAGNLHCETPRRDVIALRDGRMTIVNDHVPFGHGYAAVNRLSATGVNVHLLLKGHFKQKDPARYKSAIPYLVFISGRQDTAVRKILKDLKSRPVDPEEIALLYHAHGSKISGHLGRGFTILDTNEENKTVSKCEKVCYLDYVNRPLWFVYSGMGSQYSGMGVDLMRIPVFASAIEKCQRALKPKGIDVFHIITSSDKTIFHNILYSFVGIAAIQIGLTDVLRELGIVPDKIIGHSVGELGCAYADGCFTAEEMILSAYSRGLVSVQTPFIRGSMAAVGIGYQQIVSMCPPEIEVACHNGPDSCTISGPENVMREFVTSLVAKNIFAKEVPCSNIAYHSRYIANAGPGLLECLRGVIKTPKARSERWLSTSVPMDKWDEPIAKYSSAEYHTNNLLNPVLFEETSCLIPSNAILVEIAPHGLMQSILKRSLPTSCTNIPLTRRGYSDNVVFLLEAVGKLYMEGLNPKIQILYPKIEFPVSTGTPMLSHLVEWSHDERWPIPLYSKSSRKFTSTFTNIISLHDEEYSYLKGHVIGGKILYPFSAVLVAVWDTLAMTMGVARRTLAVQFRDIMLNVQPIMHDRRQLRLRVTLLRNNGRFEVMDDMDSNIASGFVNDAKYCNEILEDVIESQSSVISSRVIYDHFNFHGFSYKDCFKSIVNTNLSFTKALIQWSGNWVTFIDGLFQLNNLRNSYESYSHPNFILKLNIDPNEQYEQNDTHMTAIWLESYNLTKCGGVLIQDIHFNDMTKLAENSTKLRGLKFVPHFASNEFDFETILQVFLQIVAENVDTRPISVIGIYDNQSTLSKFNEIKRIMENVPEIPTLFTWLKRDNVVKEQKNAFSGVNLFLICDLATNDYMCQLIYEIIEHNTFIINLRDNVNNLTNVSRPSALYQVVCDHSINSALALELTRWRPTKISNITSVISVYSSSEFPLIFHEVNTLRPNQHLLVITTYPAVPGLKKLLNEIKKKTNCKVHLLMSNNDDEEINVDTVINVDLAVKVVRNGVLGGEYYVPINESCNVKGNVTLQSSQSGQIESLKWIQASPQQQSPGVSVKVHYAALNDLDAKRLIGVIPSHTTCRGYGMDFSGKTESGVRVMGLIKREAASALIQVHPDLMWPVPHHWSLEDAATVPFAYCLAYYCLAVRYKLYPGMRVLVHGGAGGLGQAVISLALANRCEVYTTVSNIRKKEFLLKMYPNLKAENIGNSRDLTFCDLVLESTNGEGVDVVISMLSGELKTLCFKCVAFMGTMIDVSQIPNRENFVCGMYNIRGLIFSIIDFMSIFNEQETMKLLQRMIKDGIVTGSVRPLSRVIYKSGEIFRAFRMLAGSNQRGRVLLNLQQTDNNALRAQPRLQCSSDKLHVIISDHKDFGQHMADMLISRGVRKIYLHLPVSHEDYKLTIRQWQKQGVEVSCEYSSSLAVPGFFTDDWAKIPERIEGIYIIITAKHRSVLETVAFVEATDTKSREMFPELKYFAVVNTANSVGEETCMSRRKGQFAATMLRLPGFKETGDNGTQEQISMLAAMEAVERAITSDESILSAHIVCTSPNSLLQQIAALAGLNFTQDIKGNTTLSDLGLNTFKANIVEVYLRNTYNIFFTADEVRSLTIERINHIDKTLTKTNFGNDKGLNELFTFVDADEIVATTEMIFMPTPRSSTKSSNNEFDVTSPYLCIVPGVEGHYGRFRTLCERLKLPALVFQPDISRPHETIPEMARRYAEILSKTSSAKKHFYLLGYERGVFVVLEMAAILEENGFTTHVFCIGTPNEIQTEIKEHLKGLNTKEELQDALVRHMFILMTKTTTGELDVALVGVSSWQEKLNVTVKTMLGKISHSAQYARQLIVASYERLESLLQYKMKVRALHSQVILLQPISATELPRSAVQQCSQQSVVCYELRAPLSQALDDVRCAGIVNAHLNADILKEFETTNLCESYLVSSNTNIVWKTELD